jgi:probable F420-dependent oxidoreductase
VKFGALIPTYAPRRLDYATTARIREFARRAEALGFTSLWVADHTVNAPGMFDHACLSALLVLAHAAAVTTRVALGTSVLILPIRHPVLVAKDLATLDAVSGGRLIVGVGSGWNPHAFQATGVDIAERGGRTDEAIAVIRRLLTESTVSHHGRYYRFDGVSVTPQPESAPPMWVAGGSEPGKPIAPSVVRRIARADGWIARARGSNAMVKADWAQITAYCRTLGRDPGTLAFAHINFVHVVPTTDRDEALDRQRERFLKTMGARRSWEQLQENHLTGTPEDIVARLVELEDVGLTHVILSPLDYDLEQLELYAAEIIPRVRTSSKVGSPRH